MHEANAPARIVLHPEPLCAAAFEPFGEVIEAGPGAAHYAINDGFAERFHDLARVDTSSGGGNALVSMFRARPRALPLRLGVVERHALGSQLFMPLAPLRFLVVVAAAGSAPQAAQLRCFRAGPGQGVNLARGTWHHPLLALDAGDFLVIDRGGPGAADDCEVQAFDRAEVWVEA